ncbi:MAG: hypothetical protein MN733_29620 [Nitrososphaera sp.]|nr:hypothetical protein [Nitrososphaera sp.]
MSKKEIIKKMNYARDVHLQWAREQEYRRRNDEPEVSRVGNASHHRRWAKIYDATIKALRNE